MRPYLGVSYRPLKGISDEARKQVRIPLTGDQGVLVLQVYPGSPADKAGLQTYDVILEANRQKIADADSLSGIIQKMKVGDTLTLLVSRDGRNIIVPVTLREQPATFGQPSPQDDPQQQQSPQEQVIPMP